MTMSTPQTSDKIEINLSLVTDLIAQQFPQWAHLPIRPIEKSGWDNKMFRLGQTMTIRLPSAHYYAAQVPKEQRWLPLLAPHLSFSISRPLAFGVPSSNYPWRWSVYQWIEGENADILHDDKCLRQFAVDIAQFLKQLHRIDVSGGPSAGEHNFYRGGSPSVYDSEARAAIVQLRDLIDVAAVTVVWERAISSTWNKAPVWVHGDFSVGNILVKDNRLTAVIDFGCMAVGDPACDLVIAWTFLTDESRKIFKEHMQLDSGTWARACGWALWKALITIASLEDKNCPEAIKHMQVVDAVIKEHVAGV